MSSAPFEDTCNLGAEALFSDRFLRPIDTVTPAVQKTYGIVTLIDNFRIQVPVVLDRCRLYVKTFFNTLTLIPAQVLQGKQRRRYPFDVPAGQFCLFSFGPVFGDQENRKRFGIHAGVAGLYDAAAIVMSANPVFFDIEARRLLDQRFKRAGGGIPALAGHAVDTDNSGSCRLSSSLNGSWSRRSRIQSISA